ncbi:DUF2194 domain-containing protein [Flavobacterium sp. CYK-55]|uniref:DUF2194 domain-containing protein n=1 Tax=Flavobacterium sp. CYK-55 TaxID=2835529 RepID=UPI001BD17966|nr:DUF2194 domain-containing protein [Flavobacterium sp. CYK-55]MBS7786861.1 DUF2194 domain-containing protein [Flavobacterium sp. CYK-55]
MRYLLLVFLALSFLGCEGIEDWSELQKIDLFNNKDGQEKGSGFKRYTKPSLSARPVIQSIYDPTMKYSVLYNSEVRKACDYTKMPFYCIPVDSWNASPKIAATTRVIMLYNTKKLSDASIPKLLDFVSAGGTLFIPFADEDRRMAYLLGFKPEAEYATDTKATGFYFNSPMLPGMKDRTYANKMKLFGFAAQNFSSKIKVLATAMNNPKYPAIIENSIGAGRVLFLNTSGDFGKIDRGFLFAGVLRGLEGIPYPIANTATIFLDDFPAPQYDIKAEPVKSEMDMTTADFVSKIWWPDMRDLGKEYKIPYAAMLTFDYRNKIVPPFTLDQWNSRKIKTKEKSEPLPDWLVNDVKKNGHELAFHGYNHVSLTKHLWRNTKFIPTAMNTVKKKWELSDYGKLPATYVPPSNEIDAMGVKTLKDAMPSIKYMCSLFLGQKDEGGDREFDYDPYDKRMFDYPRISSGFYFSDTERYAIHSMYLFTGIWTHFVHPDDIYQIPATADKRAGGYSLRNGLNLGWRKSKNSDKAMFPEFKVFMKQMTSFYPQMRFVNGEVGGDIVMNWRASRFSHEIEKGFYTVKQIGAGNQDKEYWFIFVSNENADKIEGSLRSQSVLYGKTPLMDGWLISVYSNKSKLTLPDLLYRKPKERTKIAAIMNAIRADFAQYKLDVKNFASGSFYAELAEKKHKDEMAALKNKMLTTPEIDPIVWNKYMTYLSWDDKALDIWKMYEEHVAKYPSKNNVMYSKELDKQLGYKTDVDKERWMSEQMKVSPEDKSLIKNYIVNFDSEEYNLKIKEARKSLYKLEPTPQNYKDYIKHLLQFNPDEAYNELKDKKALAEWSDIATQITWLFADNGNYEKAIEWSDYSNEIDFVQKMNWYIESGKSKEIEPLYKEYIAKHPEDEIASILMANIYHEQGRFKDSWVLANSLHDSFEKEELRKVLNRDVLFEKANLQQDLIAHHAALFYPDVLKKLTKEIRLAHGNFIDFKTSLETNQKNPQIQKNLFSYNFYNQKNQIHSVGITYSKYYKLDFTDRVYEDNFDNYLVGMEYKFTTAQRESKPQYWARGRFEIDKFARAYPQGSIGFNQAKDKQYRSAELSALPVETAGGLNQKMYQIHLIAYQDMYILKHFNVSFAFEGHYYTDGLLSRDTIGPVINPERHFIQSAMSKSLRQIRTPLPDGSTRVDEYDQSYNLALTTRVLWDNGEPKKSKLLPFLESQVSYGSRDMSLGYPYWMVKNRLYGGGGLGWEYKTDTFQSRIEGGYFFDSFASHFARFSSSASYQLFDYTALTLGFEIFEQSKFYSNNIQFGIKHNFKPKYKKVR